MPVVLGASTRYSFVVLSSLGDTYCVECDSFTYDTERHDAWHESAGPEH